MKKIFYGLTFVAALGFSAVSFAQDPATTPNAATTPANVDQQMQDMSKKMSDMMKCRTGMKLMMMGVHVSKMGAMMQTMKTDTNGQAAKLVDLGKQMFTTGQDLKGSLQCGMGKKGMMMMQDDSTTDTQSTDASQN